MLCLFASGIECLVIIHCTGKPETLFTATSVSHLLFMLMVLYVGCKRDAGGLLNTLAFVMVVGFMAAWPFAISFQRTPLQELGALIGIGIYGIVVVAMPILCVLTHLAVKRSSGVRRGFPVMPVPPRKDVNQ